MASGILTQQINAWHSLKLVWSSVADPNTNTSLVTMQLYYVLGSGASVSIGSRSDAYMTYDGVNVGFTASAISFSGPGERLLGSTSRTINHNPDGTKTVNVSATYPMRATISGTYYASVTVSGSAVLDTVPRASDPTLSISTQEMGQSITINTNRASTSFVHTLEYTFGSQSGTIATNVGASHAWTLPLSLANAIPNATSGSGTITCKTYNDGVLIGTKTVSFTATVPASVVPTIGSITITEAEAGLAAQFLAYVQNKSRLNVVTVANGAYSSTISQIRVTIQAKNYTGTNITSDIVTASGTVGVVLLVTDSRGRTATQTVNVTVVAYTNPAINSMDAYRVNGSGVPSDDGTSIAIPMNFAIASVNSKNTKSWSLQYRVVGAGTWSNLASGSVYTYNATYTNLTGLFNANNSYEIRLTITDYFASIERIVTISTAFTLLNVNPSGKGFAIGKVSESDTFEVALPTDFSEAPTVNGQPITMSAADILTAIKTVDGAGSGLDANLLDGINSTSFVQTSRTITAGNGMTGGGDLSANRTLTMGTPGTVTPTSTNGVTSTSHTHAINFDVIESVGSASGQHWIKFTDGTLIKWGTYTLTSAISTSFGNIFISGVQTVTFNTTVPFIAAPSVTMSSADTTGNSRTSWGMLNGLSATAFTYQLARATSQASQAWIVQWMAIGRWKA